MRKRIISLTVVLSMVLAMIPAFSLTASAESLTVSGGGTGGMDDPYKIANLDDLEAFREYINSGNGSGEYFKLTAPIDMSDKHDNHGGKSRIEKHHNHEKWRFRTLHNGGNFNF